MAHGTRSTRELDPAGGALHPSEAAYLRNELLKQRGISAKLRHEGDLSQVMVEPQQANEALQLRELLFEDADDTPPSTGMRRHRLSKPLTTGALVTMMSIVLASRLGSNAGLGVLFGLFFGVIAFLILRLQES